MTPNLPTPSKPLAEYISPEHQERFMSIFLPMQTALYQIAQDKGFWDRESNPDNGSPAVKLCLVHAELSEALEAMRAGNPPSDKLHEFGISHVEEEMADAMIRLMDLAGYLGFNLGRAICKKAGYNTTREYKHGKAF